MRQSRDSRKAYRRNKQQQAVDAKAADEAKYFWQCVDKGGAAPPLAGARELFGQQSTGINFAQYEKIPVTRGKGTPSNKEIAPLQSFRDVNGVPPWLKATLTGKDRLNYETPTPIQKHTIPLALAGHDVVATAQTGSGKTVAFLLPCLTAASAAARERKKANQRGPATPSTLVLAPTRELATQIAEECAKLCFDAPKQQKNWCVCCYGGANARPQLSFLARGVEVLVATPGRLVDFLERSTQRGPLVDLSNVRFAVLDEADRMLDMGFEPQLKRIVAYLPPSLRRQTLMFSATFSQAVKGVAQTYLDGSRLAEVTVGRVGSSVASISQFLVEAPRSGRKQDKFPLLRDVLVPNEKTIVFVQRKRDTAWVCRELRKKLNVRAEDIHGDRNQSQREAALAAFKAGRCDVLCATDVAARGLDVTDVQHVVQFDLPQDEFDTYVHRIGRTGRAGKTGRATAFFVPGYETNRGNQDLHRDLVRLFKENKQPLPQWFLDTQNPRSAKNNGHVDAKRAGSYGDRGGNGYSDRGGKGGGRGKGSDGGRGGRGGFDGGRGGGRGKGKGDRDRGGKGGKGRERRYDDEAPLPGTRAEAIQRERAAKAKAKAQEPEQPAFRNHREYIAWLTKQKEAQEKRDAAPPPPAARPKNGGAQEKPRQKKNGAPPPPPPSFVENGKGRGGRGGGRGRGGRGRGGKGRGDAKKKVEVIDVTAPAKSRRRGGGRSKGAE